MRSCIACGVTTVSEQCVSCGAPTGLPTLPVVRNTRIGCVALVTDGGNPRQALVVAEPADHITLGFFDGQHRTYPLDEATHAGLLVGRLPHAANAAWSLAGRLVLAAWHSSLSSLDMPREQLLPFVTALAASSRMEQRLLYLDLLRADDTVDAEALLLLQPGEKLWLQALRQEAAGDAASAWRTASALPADRYFERARFIWAAAASPTRAGDEPTDQLLSSMHAWVRAHDAAIPSASALAALTAAGPLTSEQQSAVLAAATVELDLDTSDSVYMDLTRFVSTGQLPVAGLPSARFSHYNELRDEHVSPSAATLAELEVGTIDDLIDGGRLGAEHVGIFENLADAAYLIARVAPERLSDQQLEMLPDFQYERERRQLGQVPMESVSTPELRRCAALRQVLHGLREGTAPDARHLHLLSLDDRDLVEAFERFIVPPASLPEEVLCADRSLWPLLLDMLTWEVIAESPDRQVRHVAAFTAHAALVFARAALYAWQWERARMLAKVALRHASAETVSDEAHNVLAYISWLNGDDHAALAELRTAVAGEYTEALQSNLIVVALGLPGTEAVEALAQIVDDAPSKWLRTAAAVQALVALKKTNEGLPDFLQMEIPDAIVVNLDEVFEDTTDSSEFCVLLDAVLDADATLLHGVTLSEEAQARHPEWGVAVAYATSYEAFGAAAELAIAMDSENAWINRRIYLALTELTHELVSFPNAVASANSAIVMLKALKRAPFVESRILVALAYRMYAAHLGAEEMLNRKSLVSAFRALHDLEQTRILLTEQQAVIFEFCQEQLENHVINAINLRLRYIAAGVNVGKSKLDIEHTVAAIKTFARPHLRDQLLTVARSL